MSSYIKYSSFSAEKADKYWENFPLDIAIAKKSTIEGEGEIVLTPVQEYIKDTLIDLSEPEIEKEMMMNIDLLYGGVSNIEASYEDSYNDMMEVVYILIKHFNLPHENDVPKPGDLIKLYENLKKEDLEKLQKIIIKEFYGGEDDGNTISYGLEFLQSLKPVVKDLKETPNSILVCMRDGYPEPKSAEKLLDERAQKHIDQYKNYLISQ